MRGRGGVTFDPQYSWNLPLKIYLCPPLTFFRGTSSFRTEAAGSSTVERASQRGTNSEAGCACTRHRGRLPVRQMPRAQVMRFQAASGGNGGPGTLARRSPMALQHCEACASLPAVHAPHPRAVVCRGRNTGYPTPRIRRPFQCGPAEFPGCWRGFFVQASSRQGINHQGLLTVGLRRRALRAAPSRLVGMGSFGNGRTGGREASRHSGKCMAGKLSVSIEIYVQSKLSYLYSMRYGIFSFAPKMQNQHYVGTRSGIASLSTQVPT